MKKPYETPLINCVIYLPNEQLAVNFPADLLGGATGQATAANTSKTDICIKIK